MKITFTADQITMIQAAMNGDKAAKKAMEKVIATKQNAGKKRAAKKQSFAQMDKINPIEIVEKDGKDALMDQIAFVKSKDALIYMAKINRLNVPQSVVSKKVNLKTMCFEIAKAAEKKAKDYRLAAG